MQKFTIDNLDGFPTDVVIAALVARLGGEVWMSMSPGMQALEGIETKDLVITLNFEEDVMTLSLRERSDASE